jgi:hypothetical protein
MPAGGGAQGYWRAIAQTRKKTGGTPAECLSTAHENHPMGKKP